MVMIARTVVNLGFLRAARLQMPPETAGRGRGAGDQSRGATVHVATLLGSWPPLIERRIPLVHLSRAHVAPGELPANAQKRGRA